MAHDPSLAYADYFAAGSGGTAASLVQEVDAGESELYGLQLHHHQQHPGGRVEMFGVRGLAMAAAAPETSGVDDGSSTIQFVLGEQQQHHRQVSQAQAPLSLALHRPAAVEASSLMLHHQQLGAGAPRQPEAPWMQSAWHLRGSRFLLPTQQLLQEFCSLPAEATKNPAKPPKAAAQEDGDGGSSAASWAPSPQIQTMEAVELQRVKAKLYTMLEEVDRRYRRYCEQMRAVAGSFEAVAGERAAAGYTRLASRTISRHFRSLRDGVAAQLQAVRRALGEKDAGGGGGAGGVPGVTKGETPRLRVLDQCLRQHKAYQAGMLDSHPWRPQRGLPERAVSILRAWLFEHFLHPYPSDVDKHILARQTGLSRGQVSNWFINARVRLWKPMVEEMYSQEMKGQEEGSGQSQSQASNGGLQNPNPSGGYTSEGRGGEDGGGGEHKPTRAQLLHDAGSLASVVSIGSGGAAAAGRMDHHQSINFGMMDHLDFDAYEAAAAGGQPGFVGGSVSLTLGLQQHADHHGGVNVAAFAAAPPSSAAAQATEYLFMAGEQQVGGAGAGVHSAHGHHGQFDAGMDGDAASHYRALSATGFHLLHDLAG